MPSPQLRLIASSLLLLLLLAACGGETPTATPGTESAAPAGGTTGSTILISAQELTPMLEDANLRIVDLGSKEEFAAGHIPGATNLTWDQFGVTDTGDASIAKWQAEVEKIIGTAGIGAGNKVVIYDHGSLWGARLWWVLDQLGHADKRILDGGFAAWQEAKGPTSTATTSYAPATYTGTPKTEVLATAAQVEASLNKPGVALVDARSAEEYSGQNTSGTARGGHIPGAVNVPYATVASGGSPNYFKTPEELRALYAAKGVTPDKEVLAYCSTGVRGAVDYVSLRIAGFENVRVYTGSWAEWGNRDDLPVEK